MARITKENYMLAEKTWKRWSSGMNRGHLEYQKAARKNEDFYLGGGRQWSKEDKALLDEVGRPALEPNLIFSIVNSVLGYQTQSRMSITYRPREQDDGLKSTILSKLGMYVLDRNSYSWIESAMFADGIIQQRGYLDVRLDFDDNMFGNISITIEDPLSVMPDPEANSYDPDDWSDVIISKWLSFDEVEELYGKAMRRKVENSVPDEQDWGTDGTEVNRNKFGDDNVFSRWTIDESGTPRVRVLERQYWKLQTRKFFVDLETGELELVPEGMSDREINKSVKASGQDVVERVVKRVRWVVCTSNIVLHDDWSPYKHFTIIPYFPYFRRGKTAGIIDNLISTQEMVNKTFSQILHVINTSANSGWIIQENSLTNMDTEDLEDVGAQSGIVLEYKAGREKPEKITPNQIPTGLDNMVVRGFDLMKSISGVHESFMGGRGPEVSGEAIQTRVHQNTLQLASPMDNLFRTRHMLALRILELIQEYYTEPRSFLITSSAQPTESEAISINQEDESLGIINDVSVGKYDVVVADTPAHITSQSAQLAEAIELRKFGVAIPDHIIVKYSSLDDRDELAKELAGGDPQQQQMTQEQQDLMKRQAESAITKNEADTLNRNMDSLSKATEIAVSLAYGPEIEEILDSVMERVDDFEEEEPAPTLGEMPNNMQEEGDML